MATKLTKGEKDKIYRDSAKGKATARRYYLEHKEKRDAYNNEIMVCDVCPHWRGPRKRLYGDKGHWKSKMHLACLAKQQQIDTILEGYQPVPVIENQWLSLEAYKSLLPKCPEIPVSI